MERQATQGGRSESGGDRNVTEYRRQKERKKGRKKKDKEEERPM